MPRHGTETKDKLSDLHASVAASPTQSAAFLALLAGVALTSPAMAAVSAAAGLAFLARRPRPAFPPLGSEPLPGMRPRTYQPWESYVFGRHAETGEPLRATSDVVRMHCLVTGAPAGSRSLALTGMEEAPVEMGSGVLHVDGRGDTGPADRLAALARKHGREDDFLLLDLRPRGEAGPTNTWAPFAQGSSDNLTQLVVGLLDETGTGDGAMWKGRATAWLCGLLRAMTWRRGNGFALTPSSLLARLGLDAMVALAAKQGEWEGVSDEAATAARNYLASLPGYVEERGDQQSKVTRQQHAWLEAWLRETLEPLATDYAHVFDHGVGDVDMHDLVLQRRILAVTLPAPGKGPKVLGRLVVAGLKGMMGAALGTRIESSWNEVIEHRMTHNPHPNLCVLDDVGDYAVEGLALMAAQARSLGFGMVYGADDVASLRHRSEREGASIVANTNRRIVLAEGPDAEGRLLGTLSYKAEEIPFEAHRPSYGRNAMAATPAALARSLAE